MKIQNIMNKIININVSFSKCCPQTKKYIEVFIIKNSYTKFGFQVELFFELYFEKLKILIVIN